MRALAALLLLALPLGAYAQAHFHHVHLNATDPATAIEFYTSKFKARKESKRLYRDVQIAPAAFVMADHVSMIIYPVEYPGGTFVSTRGRVIDHLGFSVDDLDATLARMRNEGIKVTTEPRSIADGRIKFALLEGPDQVAIELIQDSTPRPAAVSD